MKVQETEVAFVGSVVPESLSNNTPAMSVAGNMFQMQLVKALKESFASFPTVISFMPIATFPGSRKILVPAFSGEIAPNWHGEFVPFINLHIIKQVSILISCFIYLAKWLLTNRKKRRTVFVYNVYPPVAIASIVATLLLGGKNVAVVFDYPHNLAFNKKGWKGLFQRLDVKIEALCLSSFDAVISATKYVAEDLCSHLPSLVMEGGADISDASVLSVLETSESTPSQPICLFSGTLFEANGIDLMLEAFSLIMDDNIRLWIFGKGPLERRVRDAASRDKRIVYWGNMPNIEVRAYQRRATVLLNARPSKQEIARYTFPSKLREYMISGRPVITTVLPGIPAEYYEYLFRLEEETPAKLAELILQVCYKSPDELNEYGQRAREFIYQNKSWALQGKRIYEFINRL